MEGTLRLLRIYVFEGSEVSAVHISLVLKRGTKIRLTQFTEKSREVVRKVSGCKSLYIHS